MTRLRAPAAVLALLLASTICAPARAGLDGDGFTPELGDCDDLRPEVHPGAPELCDGIDNDCDGDVPADEVDEDGDSWRRCAGDCDDQDPLRHPWADEACDGVDTDCDGVASAAEIDTDGDGQAPCAGDCDDDDRAVRLGALEQCDGADNDCDALVDEGCETDDGEPPPDEDGGCTGRGCGWSISPSASALVLCAAPVGWFGRRRRGRGSTRA